VSLSNHEWDCDIVAERCRAGRNALPFALFGYDHKRASVQQLLL